MTPAEEAQKVRHTYVMINALRAKPHRDREAQLFAVCKILESVRGHNFSSTDKLDAIIDGLLVLLNKQEF